MQWLQLPEAERHAGHSLGAALVALLGQLAKRNNETILLGARLAARLGLQRIHAVEKSPEGYPRMWVAGWEIRNLRMVANVRETFRERPGARVLSIVGAAHKPWFDGWLGQLQGADIVDVEQVLK